MISEEVRRACEEGIRAIYKDPVEREYQLRWLRATCALSVPGGRRKTKMALVAAFCSAALLASCSVHAEQLSGRYYQLFVTGVKIGVVNDLTLAECSRDAATLRGLDPESKRFEEIMCFPLDYGNHRGDDNRRRAASR